MKSMTGFGRGIYTDRYAVTVETRSVNHRFLDVRVRASQALSFLSPEIQRRVGEILSRGSVEVIVQAIPVEVEDRRVRVNMPLASQYRKALSEMKKALDLPGEVDLTLLAGFRELFDVEIASDTEHLLRDHVMRALDAALESLDKERCREGEATRRDLLEHLGELEANLGALREELPSLRETRRATLIERVTAAISAMNSSPDPVRLEEEVLYYLDRSDVSEEVCRAQSHLDRFRSLVASDGRVGRELDFLCQEINRELNTIGAKANSAAISKTIVAAKTLLERMREQVQNAE